MYFAAFAVIFIINFAELNSLII